MVRGIRKFHDEFKWRKILEGHANAEKIWPKVKAIYFRYSCIVQFQGYFT